ncbi:hypothetical protein BDV98DRAFT_567023 [Pterulicium gracile]|uniref:Secreted protein n=1 Tax=Pterulicium gracile TaxID=1884261 RepID=A0A5C3QP27_9AGAR|nr:hypothetical protein BDV98DRAFT_567023 [Pterula gracilis]
MCWPRTTTPRAMWWALVAWTTPGEIFRLSFSLEIVKAVRSTTLLGSCTGSSLQTDRHHNDVVVWSDQPYEWTIASDNLTVWT